MKSYTSLILTWQNPTLKKWEWKLLQWKYLKLPSQRNLGLISLQLRRWLLPLARCIQLYPLLRTGGPLVIPVVPLLPSLLHFLGTQALWDALMPTIHAVLWDIIFKVRIKGKIYMLINISIVIGHRKTLLNFIYFASVLPTCQFPVAYFGKAGVKTVHIEVSLMALVINPLSSSLIRQVENPLYKILTTGNLKNQVLIWWANDRTFQNHRKLNSKPVPVTRFHYCIFCTQ